MLKTRVINTVYNFLGILLLKLLMLIVSVSWKYCILLCTCSPPHSESHVVKLISASGVFTPQK